MVPPVPTPATKMSIVPSVSSQISGPVVASWMAGIGGVLELLQQDVPAGSEAAISSAFATAPVMPLAPSVRTSFAP